VYVEYTTPHRAVLAITNAARSIFSASAFLGFLF
jgi:hypothetical protein